MSEALITVQQALGDRYQLENELGRGGMAVVYRARDLRHPRDVAVKVFDPAFGSVVGADRFAKEIAIAATLQHPGIVTLLDSGRAGPVLYYIMPLIGGETLRARLDRETQLAIPDALAIVREVADALACAHASGIVHRDIKPENVLLTSGRAMVADFGIACAISASEVTRLTERGIGVGTPEYMSPEQAGGAERVDGRSDIYSLACVCFELLAGSPPFSGRTAQAILARQLSEPPPSLRVVRPTIPPALEVALERALAKVPADRFATATEFAAALDLAVSRPAIPLVPPRRPGWRYGVAAALVLAVATAIWRPWDSAWAGGAAGGAGLDTSSYAVLPFDHDSGAATANADQLLREALSRWSGITVVDAFRVRDAMARAANKALSARAAQRVASQVGAGRYVRGDVTKLGDAIRVHAALVDATTNRTIAEASGRGPTDLGRAEALFAALADSLLFGGVGHGTRAEASTGTHSVPARQAFVNGLAAIQRWDLPAADSAFVSAAAYDPQFAQAFLWIAQVRAWLGAPPATWQSAAERAAAGRARLATRDQSVSDALEALSRGDVERACGLWDRLSVRQPFDFVAWYGLGNCLRRDELVLRDPASPSGWRFRSSYYRAALAYARALRLLPSIHRSYRAGSFASVREILKTSGTSLRRGRSATPDRALFAAWPSWAGDTLAFVPYPLDEFTEPRAVSSAVGQAVRHQREQFHELATAWVTEYPRSADAMDALAVSLDLLGNRAALDTLRRARALAQTPDERFRTAGADVWMRIKYAAPDDLGAVRGARALADSLLREPAGVTAQDALLLASLAMLTGRVSLAARLSRAPQIAADWNLSGPLASTAPALLVFAALGAPADSIRAMEHSVDSAIALAPEADRGMLRLQWLAHAATLAFPQGVRFRSFPTLAGAGDFLLDAQATLGRGDSAGTRRILSALAVSRRDLPPASGTFDALYPEAALLVALGDDQAAAAWLDPRLAALAGTEPEAFADLASAGSLVRAMILRADAAGRLGDRATASRWAKVVVLLWSDADASLQPVVRRMRALAG